MKKLEIYNYKTLTSKEAQTRGGEVYRLWLEEKIKEKMKSQKQ